MHGHYEKLKLKICHSTIRCMDNTFPASIAVKSSQAHFSRLADIAKLVNESSDLGTLLDSITNATCRYTTWDMCSIMSVDENAGLSVLMARFDPFLVDPSSASTRWELATSPVRKVLDEQRPLIIPDAQRSDYLHYQQDALARHYHTVTILPLPATDQYERRMILAVQSREILNVDNDELAFLKAIAQLAAIAVGKAQRLREETVLSTRVKHTIDSVSELMRRVLSDEAPTAVLSAVESLLDCPIAVVDRPAQALMKGQRAADPQYANALAEMLRIELNDEAQWQAKTSDDSTSPTSTPVHRREVLRVDGQQAGALYLLTDEERFDPVDELLIRQVAFALSVMLMRTVIRFKERTESQSKILDDLLSGRDLDDDLLSRAAHCGLPLGTPNRLVLIGIRGDAESARQILRGNHRAISSALANAWSANITVVPAGTLLMALISEAEGIPEARRRDLMRRSLELADRLTGSACVIAPGPVCHAPHDYAPAWQACQRAFRLSDRFARSGVVHEEDFGPYGLVFSALSSSQVDVFVANTLGALDQYDAQNRGDLLKTLEAYLDSGCRLQKCADELKVHVTTIRYRMEHIREVLGKDVDDAETRFSLELAFRLRRLQHM